MLDYTETILQKVSFNKDLFRKELIKSIHWLHKDEVTALKAWVVLNFGSKYFDIIKDTFDDTRKN